MRWFRRDKDGLERTVRQAVERGRDAAESVGDTALGAARITADEGRRVAGMAGDIASDLTDTASDNARRAVEGGQQIADTVGEVASDVRSLVSNSISGVAELPENIAEAISEEIGRISRPRPVSYRFTAVLMAVLTIFGWLFAMDIGEAIPGVGTPSLANEPDWRTSYAVIGGVIGATVGYLLDTRDNS